ncbi:MAG: triose-phosphate isomerase [Phycisphaerales bacterium]
MSPHRTPFVGGNWKMNTNADEGKALIDALASQMKSSSLETGIDVAVFPPFVYLRELNNQIGNSPIKLGAQDLWTTDNGAYTGEVSTAMLNDCGVTAVLTGHSERRHVIGESDELVNQKTHRGLDGGMTVVLCIGEQIHEREAGQTDAVNEQQIRAGLEGVDESKLGHIVIAYEPVWAIGTGKTATPGDAQEAHANIRSLIASMYSDAAAGSMRIIYGGSMKPGNAVELMAMPDIDGGLIGGASLNADDFCGILSAAQSS